MVPFKKKNSRTIFIGDIHGCKEEFLALLHILSPGTTDRVILLGDLINRGPFSSYVVRLAMESGFEMVMGNHEANYLSRVKESERYQLLRREIGEEAHHWLATRPLYIEEESFIAVHGGLEPFCTLAQSRPEVLMNIRTWDGKGKDLKSEKNPAWYEFYKEKKTVIYGHWASAGLTIRSNTVGIDSGCVYGNSLSGYVLETGQVFQVMAKRVYQETS